MRIDDIVSPGLVPNNHRLRQEVIRAISFCEKLSDSEKAMTLSSFFRDAIAYIDRELLSEASVESEKGTIDPSAISPFDDDDLGAPQPAELVPFGLVPPTPKPEVKVEKATSATKGKATR